MAGLFGDNQDQNVDYLAELVGEGKKFKTVEDLAKGKAESDLYIETVKQELASAKAELQNKMSLEDFYAKIKAEGSEPKTGDNPQPNGSEPPNSKNIEQVVIETLKKTEQERSIKNNETVVNQRASEVWGDNAEKEMRKAADLLGVSVNYLQQQARLSPSAFFKLVGLDKTNNAPSGTVVAPSTVNLGGELGTKRDAVFYRNLRASNPKLYQQRTTAIQMEKDALSMGEAFFN